MTKLVYGRRILSQFKGTRDFGEKIDDTDTLANSQLLCTSETACIIINLPPFRLQRHHRKIFGWSPAPYWFESHSYMISSISALGLHISVFRIAPTLPTPLFTSLVDITGI